MKMNDKVKILFPIFRIVVCLVALFFAITVEDIAKWNFKVWGLASFLILILVWSVWDLIIILRRILH